MTIFKKMRLKKKLKDLKEKSEYATDRMKEHLSDKDDTEFKLWATLNAIYIGEMIKITSQLYGA